MKKILFAFCTFSALFQAAFAQSGPVNTPDTLLPNTKTVVPAGFDTTGLIPITTEWLEYTIRFQNTGNDTVANVTIDDQLDEDLDWQSFELLASSHPVQVAIGADGLAHFDFASINLPDSASNATASRGFIRYRIQLDSLIAPMTAIENSASIHFDQAPAAATNTTLNTPYCISVGIDTPLEPFCEGELVESYIYNLPASASVTWTITGVVQQTGFGFSWIADTSGYFGLQLHAVNGTCVINVTEMIYVDETPVVQLNALATDTLCEQDNAIQLPEGTPAGGSFFGNGVWGTTFDPDVAGTGDQLVQYMYSNGLCTGRDSLVITVENCLGLSETFATGVTLFPNPFSGTFTVRFDKVPNGGYDLHISDLAGKAVLTQTALAGKSQTVVLPGIVAGIYTIVLTDRETGARMTQLLVAE